MLTQAQVMDAIIAGRKSECLDGRDQVNPPRTGSDWLIYAITGRGKNQRAELVGRGASEFAAFRASVRAVQS